MDLDTPANWSPFFDAFLFGSTDRLMLSLQKYNHLISISKLEIR
jgi:hypothetical protein